MKSARDFSPHLRVTVEHSVNDDGHLLHDPKFPHRRRLGHVSRRELRHRLGGAPPFAVERHLHRRRQRRGIDCVEGVALRREVGERIARGRHGSDRERQGSGSDVSATDVAVDYYPRPSPKRRPTSRLDRRPSRMRASISSTFGDRHARHITTWGPVAIRTLPATGWATERPRGADHRAGAVGGSGVIRWPDSRGVSSSLPYRHSSGASPAKAEGGLSSFRST